jgi:hypothetical protein
MPPSMRAPVLRFGAIAVVLVAGAVFLAVQGRASARTTVVHSCGLTDRQFISNYAMELESVGMYGDDYVHGSADADDLIDAANEAARIVRSSAPFDPSLQTVKRYAPVMFLEYAKAVQARKDGRAARREMVLAFSIGARVQEVLRGAQPALSAAGCDVTDLL